MHRLFLMGISTHNSLNLLVKKGLGHMKRPDDGDNADGDDGPLAQGADWHRIAGKRADTCRNALLDLEFHVALRTMAVVVEPLRYIIWFLLRCSREVIHPCSLPGACFMTSPACSPILAAAQYFSLLASGHARRLQLLWRPARCLPFLDWMQRSPLAFRHARVSKP